MIGNITDLQTAQSELAKIKDITNKNLVKLDAYKEDYKKCLVSLEGLLNQIAETSTEIKLTYKRLKDDHLRNWILHREYSLYQTTLCGAVGSTCIITDLSFLDNLLNAIINFFTNRDIKRLADIKTHIYNRKIHSYILAIAEINKRIEILKTETENLKKDITNVKSFGTVYPLMSKKVRIELGKYNNKMEASIKLLNRLDNDPIIGLQPKISENDFNRIGTRLGFDKSIFSNRKLIIYIANLLDDLQLDEYDKKLLSNAWLDDSDFLSSFQISKKEFNTETFIYVINIALALAKAKTDGF